MVLDSHMTGGCEHRGERNQYKALLASKPIFPQNFAREQVRWHVTL
jgi:hypothetical protein